MRILYTIALLLTCLTVSAQVSRVWIYNVSNTSNADQYDLTIKVDDILEQYTAQDLSVNDTLYQLGDTSFNIYVISTISAISGHKASIRVTSAYGSTKPKVSPAVWFKAGGEYYTPYGLPSKLITLLDRRLLGLSNLSGGGSSSSGVLTVYTLASHSSLYTDYPTYPKFGSDDDSQETSVDVTQYIQQVVDAAAVTGGVVKLPPLWLKVTNTINVPEGVYIEGSSTGKFGVYDLPYQDWWSSGTVISFEPVADNLPCFRFTTTDSREVRIGGIRNLTIMSDNLTTGAKAIAIDASNGEQMTSGHFEDVHIHGFRNGCGLYMYANNGGAITYNVFDNMRFRDADTSIAMIADSATAGSFINSNIFNNPVISGGNLHYGILAMTTSQFNPNVDCNHNQFYYGSIEPQYTKYGHIVVKNNAWLVMKDTRIEATQQFAFYPDVPVIYIDSISSENYIDVFGTVQVDNRGTYNYIKTHSPKNAYPNFSSFNIIENATLAGLHVGDSSRWALKNWQFGIADFSSSVYTTNIGDTIPITYVIDDSIPPQYNILKITVPPGKKIRLWPQPQDDWRYHKGKKFTVGAYIKSSGKNAAQWIYTSNSPTYGLQTIGSEFSYRDNAWVYIGGTFTNYYDNDMFLCYLTVFNDTSLNGNAPLDVYVTAPSMVWGEDVSYELGGYLEKAGGIMSGPLSLSQTMSIDINDTMYIDTSGNTTRLYLPTTSNIFSLRSDISRQITSINVAEGVAANNPYARVFDGGTIIYLLFEDTNIRINNSSYIRLLNGEDFIPRMSGSYLVLVNDPIAVNVWYELSRGTVETNYGYVEVDFSDTTFQDQNNANNLTFPYQTNYVKITNAGSGLIKYICQVENVRKSGEIILIENVSGSSITFQYPFIESRNSEDISLPTGHYLVLMQTGTNGVWKEIYRSFEPSINYGSYSYDSYVENDGNSAYWYLPLNYRFFEVINTPTTVQRINQSATIRFAEGTLISVKNSTSSDITFQYPYIEPIVGTYNTVLPPNAIAIMVSKPGGVWKIVDIINDDATTTAQITLHVLNDINSSASIAHYTYLDIKESNSSKIVKGYIYASISAGIGDTPVDITSAVNTYWSMDYRLSVQDESVGGAGTRYIERGLCGWSYNGLNFTKNVISSITAGSYTGPLGITPQISSGVLQLLLPNHTDPYTVKFEYNLL